MVVYIVIGVIFGVVLWLAEEGNRIPLMIDMTLAIALIVFLFWLT